MVYFMFAIVAATGFGWYLRHRHQVDIAAREQVNMARRIYEDRAVT